MPVVNSFAGVAFALFTWFAINGLIFVLPGLGWIQYPILLSVEILLVLFIVSSVYDASGWKPWKEAGDRLKQLRAGGAPRAVVLKDFKSYLVHFGSLAVVWCLEIVLQKSLFSTIFTTTVHIIHDDTGPIFWDDPSTEGSPNDLPLVCMDGTILFSIRQFSIFTVMAASFALDIRNLQERRYLIRTYIPVMAMCVGAFFAVLNNGTSPPVGHIFLALLWIIIRAARLVLIKWVQKSHMQTLSITRFVRLLVPLVLLILIPAFFFVEYKDLSTVTLRNADHTYSDAQQFAMVVGHIIKVFLYSSLLFSSIVLLFFGGNAVDYSSWLMFREVVWNTACGYVVGTGTANARTLSGGQITGLTFFLVSWVTYLVLFGYRFAERHQNPQYRPLQDISFENLKDEDMKIRPAVILTTNKYSDVLDDKEES